MRVVGGRERPMKEGWETLNSRQIEILPFYIKQKNVCLLKGLRRGGHDENKGEPVGGGQELGEKKKETFPKKINRILRVPIFIKQKINFD